MAVGCGRCVCDLKKTKQKPTGTYKYLSPTIQLKQTSHRMCCKYLEWQQQTNDA